MNEVKIIEDVVSPMFLEYVRYHMQESENWSWRYPQNSDFSKRHPKLTLINGNQQPPQVERLVGIAMSLFFMIYEKGLREEVYPEIIWAGAAIKDKHREDNTHTDHMDDIPKNVKVLKVLGVLNSDWKQEWGGGFTWNDKPIMQSLVLSICLTQKSHIGQIIYYVMKKELQLTTH